MNVVLISTYDLGHQPFGLASPKAWLARDGHSVRCLDLSVEKFFDADIRDADLIAFYLPMHTATRLALPVIERVKRVNPQPESPVTGSMLRSTPICCAALASKLFSAASLKRTLVNLARGEMRPANLLSTRLHVYQA